MKQIKILVAEDDPNIRMGLKDTLESEGFAVVEAADGNTALSRFETQKADLLLLDIMMPEKSGYDVCREIRQTDRSTPIIMLTAKGEEIDKVVGLELGADDYITKPFGIHELLARVKAVLRRSIRDHDYPNRKQDRKSDKNREGRFGCGRFTVDPRTYKLSDGRNEIDLSEREVNLLTYFKNHPQKVLSRDELLNAVWGINYLGTTRTLDQHIAQLRKKIESDPSRPEIITTVHGVGYRFEG